MIAGKAGAGKFVMAIVVVLVLLTFLFFFAWSRQRKRPEQKPTLHPTISGSSRGPFDFSPRTSLPSVQGFGKTGFGKHGRLLKHRFSTVGSD
jgi:hypothetical protein